MQIQMKYSMVKVPSKPSTCSVQVLLGIAWLKSTKQQKKVTKNIISNSSNRLKELFAEVEKELTSRNGSLLCVQLILVLQCYQYHITNTEITKFTSTKP
jgi:hypothetical protein